MHLTKESFVPNLKLVESLLKRCEVNENITDIQKDEQTTDER